MRQTKEAMPPARKAAPRLISRSLYADTLRRLRLTGLLLLLACTLSTLSGLLPSLFTAREAYYPMSLNPELFGNTLVIFALLSPALLMMQTFFFLYRRNGSDLYHSLPYSRRCMCLTLTAASFTWSCAVVAFPIALCALFIPFSPLPFPMALLGWMFIHHLATILLVTGCALIGASLSGTPLSGVIIAGMVLFLPRWGMTVCRYILANSSGMVSYNDINRLLSPAMHLPAADLVLLVRDSMNLYRFFGMTYAQFFQNIPGILYTLLLGAATLGIGRACFVRRRSEWAGQALGQSRWHYALHASVAVTALLWGSYFLYRGYKQYRGNWLADPQLWIGSAAVIIVCLALYLAYLWLRTKTWRAAVHAAPFMAFAVILGAALCWGATAAGLQTRHSLPGAAEIMSIRFPCEPGDQNMFFSFHNNQNLLVSQVSPLRYDNAEMRQLAADAISEHSSALDAYAAGEINYLPSGRAVSMEMELAGGGSLRRTVNLPEGRAEQLSRLLFDSPEFMSALRRAPASPYLTMDAKWTFLLPDDSHTAAIWSAFQSELSELSDLDFMRRCSMRYYLPNALNDDFVRLGTHANVTAYSWHGLDLYEAAFNVGSETPLTLDACVREGNSRMGAGFERALEAAQAMNFDRSRVHINMDFIYTIPIEGSMQRRLAALHLLPDWQARYGDAYGYVEQADSETYEAFRAEMAEKMQAVLLRASVAQDGGEPLVWASISVENQAPPYHSVIGNAYIRVSEDDFTALTELAWRMEQERYY